MDKDFIKKMLSEHKDLYSYKKDKTFVQAGALSNDKISFTNYEYLQFMVKKNDKRYIIHGIAGKIFEEPMAVSKTGGRVARNMYNYKPRAI